MFVLASRSGPTRKDCFLISNQTTISDVIRIAPNDFEPRKKSIHALEDNIHKKYADRVLQQVGLCICFWDLLKVSEGLISHGDGMVNINGRLLGDNVSSTYSSISSHFSSSGISPLSRRDNPRYYQGMQRRRHSY